MNVNLEPKLPQTTKTIAAGPLIQLERNSSGRRGWLIAALLAFTPAVWAGQQIATTIYANGNYTWTCPADVTSVQVECWGAGGGGGDANASYIVAGGGAGGAYVRYTVSVTPGTVYNLTVGAGGVPGNNATLNGATGGSSYFGNTTAGSSSGASVLAVGGPGGTGSGTAGASSAYTASLAGGTATSSGNLPSSGAAASTAGTSGGTSTGGASGTAKSGAGGVGAGSSGSSGGGAGGAAITTSGSSSAGNSGTGPGGGGGGAANVTLIKPGGAGADGQIALTCTTALSSASPATFTNNTYSAWICPSNVFSVQVECAGAGGGGGGTYASYAVASGGAGGSYVRYTMAVTPGTAYNLTVGAGGAAGNYNGGNGGTGGSSYFGNSAVGSSTGASVLAVGGPGGAGYSSSTAGLSTAEVGGGVAGATATTSGNIPSSGAAANTAGSNGGSSISGAEGTAASGAGGAGAGSSGSSGGGAGGAAVTSTSAGSKTGLPGTAPGGGGSGAANKTLGEPGGAGGDGKVVLTYTATAPTAANSTVSASPTTVVADGATTSTITVTLLDGNNNPVSGKTVTLAQTGGSGASISAASGTSASAGVVTFTVTSATSGSATFTATDTTDSLTVTATANVNFTAIINHFVVTSAGTANAGQVFTATVQAYATAGNGSPISNNGVDGTLVTMTSSGSAQFDSNSDGIYGDNTKPLTNGTFTINLRDLKAESVTLMATAGAVTGTSSSVSITADALAQLQLLLPGETAAPGTTTGKTGSAAAETAGVGFTVTVNAVDTNWNQVAATDTINLAAVNDARAILPANTALSGGTVALSLTNIVAGAGRMLTATDVSNGGISAGTSAAYPVAPGATAKMLILAPGETASFGVAPGKTDSPSAEYSTVGYAVTVDAVDAYYNLATNNTDTVGVFSSMAGDTLPANAALIGGTRAFSLTNNTVGTATLTATNVTEGTAVATGSTVVAVNFNSPAITLASSQNPADAGQLFTLSAGVNGAGTHTGTVTFNSGSTVLGTGALSAGIAILTISGGVGVYAITAVYSGDADNLGSTSSPVSQVIQASPVATAPQMQDGQDYPISGITPDTGRPPWQIDENGAASTSATGFIKITNTPAADLSGATVPDIAPLPNTTNPEAHLYVQTPGASGRLYYRSIGTPVSANSMYFSFLMNVAANPTGANEFRCSLLASTASNNAAATDPLTLHLRVGADSSHYNLGIERLNGLVAWAADSLADYTNYLVVLKYTFGSSSSNSLFINPTPGDGEPVPSASAVSDGSTPEPANLGTFGIWNSFSDIPANTGTLDFDVMRADPSWANVTPPAVALSPGAAALAFTPAAQVITVNSNSALMTVTLLDQSNNVFAATANLVVSLGSSSGGGVFLSGADGVTVISNVTILAGSSTSAFYYADHAVGSPTITGASGLLTPASQAEVIQPVLPEASVMTVTRTAGLRLLISLANLATNWSDADGYPVTLAGINLISTNGVNLQTNSAWILYTNGPNVNDQISYAISDGQGGMNIGHINIVIQSSVTGTNSITGITTGGTNLVHAFGIPGYNYILERATNLVPAVWIDVSTNAAATNGVINAADTFLDLGGVAPPTAFYQLKWQP